MFCYIQSHCFQPKDTLARKPGTDAIVMLEINGRKRVRHVANASVFRRQRSKEKCICPWMMALRLFGGILRRPVRIGFNWSDAKISQESINGRVRYTSCPVRRCSIPLLRLVILLSNSDKEGSVKKIRKSSFVSSFVGIFRSKCMNGLWVLVLGGERHAKH